MRVPRRAFLLVPFAAAAVTLRAAATEGKTVLRGKLASGTNGTPVLRTSDGRSVPLHGDEETTLVLHDKRLIPYQFEVIGTLEPNQVFEINPIHLAALWAYQNGSRKRVTYWCDICAIRTYSPGLCSCCRNETQLDLRDPDKVG